MQRDVEASVVIKGPIGDVFELVTNVHRAPEWQAELLDVKDVSDTPIDAGTTLTVVLQFLGRQIENTMQVTVYEPPNRFSMVILAGFLPVELDFVLEPAASGTQVTYLSDWELPRGFLFRLVQPAKPLFDRMDQRQWQSNLIRLKQLLEESA